MKQTPTAFLKQILQDIPLSRIAHLRLRLDLVAQGLLSGLHPSSKKGAAMEFSDRKEYVPGDSLSHLDWRAYGRMDKYYVKRFDEETELQAYILIDTSSSMNYPPDAPQGQQKIGYAQRLAIMLGYLLFQQQDAVGLLSCSTKVCLPARTGQFPAFCESVASLVTEKNCTIIKSLDSFLHHVSSRSLLIVLSDLIPTTDENPSKFAERILAQLQAIRVRHHTVLVMQVLHEDELEFPFTKVEFFEDLESTDQVLTSPQAVKKAYLQQLRAYLDKIQSGLTQNGIGYWLVRTDTALEEVVSGIAQTQ